MYDSILVATLFLLFSLFVATLCTTISYKLLFRFVLCVRSFWWNPISFSSISHFHMTTSIIWFPIQRRKKNRNQNRSNCVCMTKGVRTGGMEQFQNRLHNIEQFFIFHFSIFLSERQQRADCEKRRRRSIERRSLAISGKCQEIGEWLSRPQAKQNHNRKKLIWNVNWIIEWQYTRV